MSLDKRGNKRRWKQKKKHLTIIEIGRFDFLCVGAKIQEVGIEKIPLDKLPRGNS